MRDYMPGGSVAYTPCGMAWRDKWGSNRYAGTSVCLSVCPSGTSVCLSVCPSGTSMCLSVCPSGTSVCLSVCVKGPSETSRAPTDTLVRQSVSLFRGGRNRPRAQTGMLVRHCVRRSFWGWRMEGPGQTSGAETGTPVR